MKKRIITALIMAAILIPAVVVPQLINVLDVIFMVFVAGATIELLNMYDKEKKIALPLKIITVFLSFVLYFSIINFFASNVPALEESLMEKFLKLIKFDIVLNPAVALIAILIILMSGLVFVSDYTVSDLGRIYIAIIYVGVCASAITVTRYLGVRFIFYLLIITTSTDIFALVFGLTLGKHKMAPNISPKKTWEGAIGGSAVATTIGCLLIVLYPLFSKHFHDGASIEFFDGLFRYTDFSMAGKIIFAIVLSLFLSICSQIGDLVASKLKRNYNIKDYSNIFPGHGGILDRFDSAFFASAIFLLFIIIEMNLFPW